METVGLLTALGNLITVIGPYLAGPASGVFICLIMMLIGYHLVVKQILPEQKRYIELLVDNAEKDRFVFRESVQILSQQVTNVSQQVQTATKAVTNIKKDVDSLERDVKIIKEVIIKER